MEEDLITTKPELRPFIDMVTSVMELPDDTLTPTSMESIQGMIRGALTPTVRQQAIDQIITNYKNNNTNRGTVKNEVAALKAAVADFIQDLKPSPAKEELLNDIFAIFYEIFDEVEEKYLSFDIELPMTLENGATTPTYAHSTDAAADLYAADTVVVPAHSIGNMIRTGVHIALPEGWVAYIIPRSSIGAKTPLRLSNSVGCIDADYRGPLGVIYDNISDSDYTINAGDRIAQLIVMPCYHFKPNVVDILPATERAEGGFGSTGK